MGIVAKILLGLVGVLVAGFIGLIALGALLDEEPVADPVKGAPTTVQDKPADPPPAPNTPAPTPPKPSNNPLNVEWKPMAAQGTFTGAMLAAKGKIDYTFRSYDRFLPNQIFLARQETGKIEARAFEFVDGAFKPVTEVIYDLGALRDVSYGDFHNSGELKAIITAEKGLLMVDDNSDVKQYNVPGLRHTLVGDWDGDGKNEAALIAQASGKTKAEVWRYTADGSGDQQMGSFEAPNFPDSPMPSYLTINKRKLLLGIEKTEIAGKLPVALYSLDPAKGFARELSLPIPDSDKEQVAAMGAAAIAGKPSLVVSYQAATSFVEVFEIAEGAPKSRGRLQLPDGDSYSVIIGYFTQKEKAEILAINPFTGQYLIFGF